MATLDEIRLQQLLAPFNRTGVMSSSQAVPMINNIPMINTGAIDQSLQNTDLVNQIIMENEMKTKNISFPNRSPFLFPEEQTGITSTDQAQNFNFLNDITPSFGVANEPDVEQVEFLGKEPNFLQKLAQFIPFAGEKSLGRAIINMLPKLSPEAQNIRNFYGSQFGLTPTGQVASGIMKGYNPVSGSNLLNRFTGGLVPAKRIGLSNAIQKRISNILGRKIAQTDISRARVKKLKELRDREIRDRADFGESLSSIGKSTFTGKGQAFEKRSGGSSGKKGTSSERNYGGR